MTPAKKDPGILGRAMLVDLSISAWTARKKDRVVTDSANADFAADSDAGNYWKKLFGGAQTELGKVLGAVTALRATHYTETLPWTDKGWRLLPTANYFQYTDRVRKSQGALMEAVDRMLASYPDMIETARKTLGRMFAQADYPSAGEVRAKYFVKIDFTPLPAGDDFRVSLPSEQLTDMARSVENRVAEAVEAAMVDAWSRLGDAVMYLREHLDGDARLRDTMIEKVKTVAEAMGRLNITEDAKLETVRARVLKDLTTVSAETLRDDQKAREKAAAAADAILKTMKSVYTPTPKEAK